MLHLSQAFCSASLTALLSFILWFRVSIPAYEGTTLPRTEEEAKSLIARGFIDSTSWRPFAPYYIDPVNVADGELTHFATSLCNLSVHDFPSDFSQLHTYEPWAPSDIARFYRDYPKLKKYTPVLCFDSRALPSMTRVRITEGKSSGASISRGRGNITIEPHDNVRTDIRTTISDSGLRLRHRRLLFSVPHKLRISLGNFAPIAPYTPVYGYFPEQSRPHHSYGPGMEFMYGLHRTFNGIHAETTLHDTYCRVDGFWHLTPGETIAGVFFTSTPYRRVNIYTGFSGMDTRDSCLNNTVGTDTRNPNTSRFIISSTVPSQIIYCHTGASYALGNAALTLNAVMERKKWRSPVLSVSVNLKNPDAEITFNSYPGNVCAQRSRLRYTMQRSLLRDPYYTDTFFGIAHENIYSIACATTHRLHDKCEYSARVRYTSSSSRAFSEISQGLDYEIFEHSEGIANLSFDYRLYPSMMHGIWRQRLQLTAAHIPAGICMLESGINLWQKRFAAHTSYYGSWFTNTSFSLCTHKLLLNPHIRVYRSWEHESGIDTTHVRSFVVWAGFTQKLSIYNGTYTRMKLDMPFYIQKNKHPEKSPFVERIRLYVSTAFRF